MQVHGNFQTREQIFSVKHAIPLLHINEFDGENVRCRFKFLRRENERRMMFLVPPPLNGIGDFLQRCERCVTKHAKQIEIGIAKMKFAFRSRAVKNNAHEVIVGHCADPRDKFIDRIVLDHSFSSPASARTAAAGRTSAKAAKASPAPAESTASPATAAAISAAPARTATKQEPPEQHLS